MTPHQVMLVRASFDRVLPMTAKTAERFYARLFELAPQVRGLFGADLVSQGAKLMAMLASVVASLDRPDVLLPAAQQLAERHVAYGVLPEHYPVVGQALIDTLHKGLGHAFDADTRDAWLAAYAMLSKAMLDAAGAQPAGPAPHAP